MRMKRFLGLGMAVMMALSAPVNANAEETPVRTVWAGDGAGSVTPMAQNIDARNWRRGASRAKNWRPLAPRQIVKRLARRGYRGFNSLARRGSVYVVRARGRSGYRERLVVSAFSGKIVERNIVRRPERSRGQRRLELIWR